MTTPYNPLVPTGQLPLSEDYANLQANFQQNNTTFSVDHVPITQVGQNGYHTDIHFVPQMGDPAAVTGFGQLYTKTIDDGINTDQELWFESGLGNLIQLTRNFLPVASAQGYTFIPGGLIIQWGVNSFVSGNNAVTFVGLGTIEFPNNCFNIQTTQNSTSNSENILNINTITKTGFNAVNTSTSTRMFFWFAIGN